PRVKGPIQWPLKDTSYLGQKNPGGGTTMLRKMFSFAGLLLLAVAVVTVTPSLAQARGGGHGGGGGRGGGFHGGGPVRGLRGWHLRRLCGGECHRGYYHGGYGRGFGYRHYYGGYPYYGGYSYYPYLYGGDSTLENAYADDTPLLDSVTNDSEYRGLSPQEYQAYAQAGTAT